MLWIFVNGVMEQWNIGVIENWKSILLFSVLIFEFLFRL
jgi:hypothetical protein